MQKYEQEKILPHITLSDQEEQKWDLNELKDRIEEYIVTPRGMVGSKRTKWKGDLLIGR